MKYTGYPKLRFALAISDHRNDVCSVLLTANGPMPRVVAFKSDFEYWCGLNSIKCQSTELKIEGKRYVAIEFEIDESFFLRSILLQNELLRDFGIKPDRTDHPI